ncbi:hypothetical protein F5J12DRAFT_785109 [Pisolithus orientalis]|uniref:uncharacterized protein n=1 Tax=Pisolithus orientalis TaxID=936130 RepID=UPI00222516F0|nr:uncharacterized protein F5J12DRAFT_785109 [Pisolithus orientalis]KAI5997647.1 hypothetical protein F5J12DRAFT_785109 [Pisolithus orientalis]
MDKFLLLAVGTEGVKLWNLKTQKELTLVTHLESHGIISCAIWMKVKQAPAETLCYGTGMGYLIFMRSNTLDKHFQEICARQLGSGSEITCVAWDITQDDIVQVLSLSMSSQLQLVFAVHLDSAVPKSIAFGKNGSIYVLACVMEMLSRWMEMMEK